MWGNTRSGRIRESIWRGERRRVLGGRGCGMRESVLDERGKESRGGEARAVSWGVGDG